MDREKYEWIESAYFDGIEAEWDAEEQDKFGRLIIPVLTVVDWCLWGIGCYHVGKYLLGY